MVRGRHDQEGRMAEGAGLDVPITGVTVFKEGARVQRGGVVNLEPGLWPVVIGNLPATVDPDSGRIAARGRDLALLNARYTVATAPIPFAGNRAAAFGGRKVARRCRGA
jgi:orotidine-5'-phosphate decarboxylase